MKNLFLYHCMTLLFFTVATYGMDVRLNERFATFYVRSMERYLDIAAEEDFSPQLIYTLQQITDLTKPIDKESYSQRALKVAQYPVVAFYQEEACHYCRDHPNPQRMLNRALKKINSTIKLTPEIAIELGFQDDLNLKNCREMFMAYTYGLVYALQQKVTAKQAVTGNEEGV
jgi:hypothetical protein